MRARNRAPELQRVARTATVALPSSAKEAAAESQMAIRRLPSEINLNAL
jgi:hypothetical protein